MNTTLRSALAAAGTAVLTGTAVLAGGAAPALAGPTYTYDVTVRTGDRENAGTSAGVFLTLYGDDDRSAEIRLDNEGHDDFERGQTDRFRVRTPVRLGRLLTVRIRHDDRGKKPGWYLEHIRVDRAGEDNDARFAFHRWLARGQADNAICLLQHRRPGEPTPCP
ncbi:hypothetical protein GCM10010124_20590 [Pilimelia terevasa]|uniref:PLAT domain-containing protein n=1 Tax=Pilimelia terevasa TaxID=53372 RepID=A0A8J3BQJ9_9ACTN|nr:PLAT/LH2 domain-containing protein [Pilimelia terevasa]GGK27902.1 hypothetical protein GCM10010124_20590 [Pilimelia terevasa]